MKRLLIILSTFLSTGLALASSQEVRILNPGSLEILGFGEIVNNRFVMKLVDDFSGPVEVIMIDTTNKDFQQLKGNVSNNTLWINFPNGGMNLKTFIMGQGLEFKQSLVPKQSLRK